MQMLEMVERNELTRSVLALLDENISSAIKSDQVWINILKCRVQSYMIGEIWSGKMKRCNEGMIVTITGLVLLWSL